MLIFLIVLVPPYCYAQWNFNEPETEMFVLVAYAQKYPINAHAVVPVVQEAWV